MNLIHVPALPGIIPEFYLSEEMYGDDVITKLQSPNKKALLGYHYDLSSLPTLAELRHAYFDRRNNVIIEARLNDDGIYVPVSVSDNSVSDIYKESVLRNLDKGETTSSILVDEKYIIEKPEVAYIRHGFKGWVVEGGKRKDVELPPRGWILEFDEPTGLPSRTCEKREDAEKIFGEDTSWFSGSADGYRSIVRGYYKGLCGWGGGQFDKYDFFTKEPILGPFFINIHNRPDGLYGNHIRLCRRQYTALEGQKLTIEQLNHDLAL